jgi:sterol desaturase/sphingolipid hydroxylase (fatty acid hydroxylase superfamily)
MESWIIDHATAIRLSCFFGLFILMAVLEAKLPRRAHDLKQVRGMRWLNNISLAIIASVITRLILPISLVSFAIVCQNSSWGLFNQAFFDQEFLLPINSLTIFIVSLILFDCIIYWQHRIFHYVPFLWRLHKVHHSDQSFDVTTGIRFHPLEILLSIAIKFSVVFILGLSAESIIVFEVMLNALALFNHSNVKIPLGIDYYLRKLIVTPDMHRVHHSQIPQETNSNFGFNISLWDRVFGSYQAQPSLGHDDIEIGLKDYNDSDQPKHLVNLLLMPLKSSNK